MSEINAIIVGALTISLLVNAVLAWWIWRKNKQNSSNFNAIKNDAEQQLMIMPATAVTPIKDEKTASSIEETKKPPPKLAPPSPAEPKLKSREEILRSEVEQHPPGHVPEKMQRSDRQKLMEPVGRVEFSKFMMQIVEFINEYFDESHKHSVVPENDTSSGRVRKLFSEKPEQCQEIITDLRNVVVKGMCHTQHPRYHARFIGRSLADILSSTISTAMGFDVSSSPVIEVIERVLSSWMCAALGLPKMRVKSASQIGKVVLKEPIGTVFYSMLDVYLCVVQHCINRLNDDMSKSDKKVLKTSTYVVYCSDDAHYFLEDACELLRIKVRKVVTKKSEGYGMSRQCLEKQIRKDVEKKLTPLAIFATFGSLSIAADDHIKELAEFARISDIWIHLDANYAGCRWIDPDKRVNVHTTLNDVNSFHINFSTMLPFAGKICIAYAGEKLLPDYALSRPQSYGENSLRLWILLRLYGMRSIREAIKRKIMLGNMMSDRIAQHTEYFHVFHPNDHGITLFQYKNSQNRSIVNDNKMTSMFYNFLNLTSQMKFSIVRFQGKVFIRSCVNYERSNASMIEESASTLRNLADDFEESLKKSKNDLKEAARFEYLPSIRGSPNETTDKTQSDEKN